MTNLWFLIGDGIWLLLLVGWELTVNFRYWTSFATKAPVERKWPSANPLSTASILYFIVVIISVFLAAFLYFRATFPH